jgi:hypothetical protein
VSSQENSDKTVQRNEGEISNKSQTKVTPLTQATANNEIGNSSGGNPFMR